MKKLLGLIYILYPFIMALAGRLLAELYHLFLYFEVEAAQYFILKYICPAVLSCALLCLVLMIQWNLRDDKCYKWIVTVMYILGVAIASMVLCKSKILFMVVLSYGSPISEMIILMFLFIFTANIMIGFYEKNEIKVLD